MRLRTSDGEMSWDNPGPMFLPEEDVEVDEFNTPTELRTIIGHLVACPNDPEYEAVEVPGRFLRWQAGRQSRRLQPERRSPEIPPDGTVVAVAAFFDGMLHELEIGPGGWTGETRKSTSSSSRSTRNTSSVIGKPARGARQGVVLGHAGWQ